MVSIKFNFGKKHLIVLIILGVIFGVGFVLAVVPNPGHSWSQMETELLYIEPTGGVRIGETDENIDNTNKGLSVKGVPGENVAIAVGHSTTQSAGLLWANGVGGVLYTYNDYQGNQQPMYYRASKHVFDAGQIGIGDSTPESNLFLDVEGPIGASQYCDNNGANCKTITDMGGGAGYWIKSGNNIYYTDGNVGIGAGAETPLYPLHVAGQIYATSKVTGANELCIGGDCRTSWPSGGSGLSCSDCDSRFVNTGSDSANPLVLAGGGGTGANIEIYGNEGDYANKIYYDGYKHYFRKQDGGTGTDVQIEGSMSVATKATLNDFEWSVFTGTGQPLCYRMDGGYYKVARCSSSIRHKENIKNLNLGLETVEKLKPRTFNWKESGEKDFGLIAEEAYLANPLFVSYNEEGKIEGVKYEQLTVVLINAIKEQQKQIGELKEIVCKENPQEGICR